MKGMTTQFQVSEYTARGIARGERNITVSVLGYWSRDPITVYVRRELFTSEIKWNITINHSSGGRDTDEVESDIDAEYNFGCALIEASKVARDIQNLIPEIEAEYQVYKAELKAEYLAEEKIEADPAIGSNASLKVAEMITHAGADRGNDVTFMFYERDTERVVRVNVCKTHKTVFRVNGKAVSRNEVVELVSKCSARATF